MQQAIAAGRDLYHKGQLQQHHIKLIGKIKFCGNPSFSNFVDIKLATNSFRMEKGKYSNFLKCIMT
jgi:hypothetical protein